MSNFKLHISPQAFVQLGQTVWHAKTAPTAGAIEVRLWERIFKDPGYDYKLLAGPVTSTTQGGTVAPVLLKELTPTHSGREMYIRCEVGIQYVSQWAWKTEPNWTLAFATGLHGSSFIWSNANPIGGSRCWYYRVHYDPNNVAASLILFGDSSIDNKTLAEFLGD